MANRDISSFPTTIDHDCLDIESVQTTRRDQYENTPKEFILQPDEIAASNNPTAETGDSQYAIIDEILARNEDEILEKSSCRRCLENLIRFVSANAIPDEITHIGRFHVIESTEAVRILKFLIVTTLLIVINHLIVRSLKWENDGYYSLTDFFYFDFGNVMLYSVTFAIVGRIGKKKGVDRLLFILPVLISSIFTSASTNVWFLRNSITFYNISCSWPWQLAVFAVIIFGAIGTIVFLHVRNSIRDSSHIKRLVEITFLVMFFGLPPFFHPHFHLHHYYSFWLLGMVVNRDEWWSRLTMSIAWGNFINGVSVYGLDPIHTCAHALHVSIGNSCLSVKAEDSGDIKNAMDKYGGEWIEALLGSGSASACFNPSTAKAPDFRNCTSQ